MAAGDGGVALVAGGDGSETKSFRWSKYGYFLFSLITVIICHKTHKS